MAWTPEVAEAAPRVHVKLDTGMGRLGTKDRELALRLAARPDAVGVMTHFATADEPGDELFPAQLEAFAASSRIWVATTWSPTPPTARPRCAIRPRTSTWSVAGSRCTGWTRSTRTRRPTASSPRCRSTRGSPPCAVSRRATAPGTGAAGHAGEPTWVATVPIGYGDGWRRALTNNCDVLIRGRRHPLVGTVSMDNVTVALEPDTDVRVGDEVVLIGRQGDERILAEEVARRLGTINYEVTCGLSPRVRAKYVR